MNSFIYHRLIHSRINSVNAIGAPSFMFKIHSIFMDQIAESSRFIIHYSIFMA